MYVKAHFLKSKEESKTDFRLSVSKAKTFDDCKAKFKFSYIEKLPKKEWDFHVFGKYLHDILEIFHKKLIENPTLSFEPLMKECVEISTEKYKDSLNKDQKHECNSIIKTYLELINEQKNNGKLPNVIGVEKDFYIDLNGKVLLNGFIDRVQIDPDGMLHVADYKTTKDKKYLKDFFQLLTYAYVLMLEDPSIKKIRTSFILLRHDFDHLTHEYTRKDVEPIGKKFLEYAEKINNEKIWRPNPQFLCKYCDFLENCSAGESYLIKRGIISQKKQKETFGLGSW